MRFSPPSEARERNRRGGEGERQEKEVGSLGPHLGHKLPQCGRFSGFGEGVAGRAFSGMVESQIEKSPIFREKYRGSSAVLRQFHRIFQAF